mmetsp:Transcript_25659/g.56270  ORF Transcript_25659/g.56270 Transcript_25659/m.56270 type:complete len:214 (+) Transcript_25659:804-1445(+)
MQKNTLGTKLQFLVFWMTMTAMTQPKSSSDRSTCYELYATIGASWGCPSSLPTTKKATIVSTQIQIVHMQVHIQIRPISDTLPTTELQNRQGGRVNWQHTPSNRQTRPTRCTKVARNATWSPWQPETSKPEKKYLSRTDPNIGASNQPLLGHGCCRPVTKTKTLVTTEMTTTMKMMVRKKIIIIVKMIPMVRKNKKKSSSTTMTMAIMMKKQE